MVTIDITSENLDEIISSNDVVMIEIFAPWCGHCRQYTPVFTKVSGEIEDAVFGLVNTDISKDLPGKFGVAGVPTTVGFKNGIFVGKKSGGLTPRQLEDFTSEVKSHGG